MKKFFILVFSLCVISIGAFALGTQDNNLNKSSENRTFKLSPQELENELKNVANAMNKGLPQMVDKITRLDRVSVKNNVVTYHYTIIDSTKNLLGENFSMFENTLKNGVTKNVCATPTIVDILNLGATLEYIYHISNSSLMTEFKITRSSCN